MKRLGPLTAVLCTLLMAINALGQVQERAGEQRAETRVALVQEINDAKVIIFLENEDFIVKASLSGFKNDIDHWLQQYPHLKEDKKLLDRILHQAKNNNIIDASIITDRSLVSRLKYRVASLLENGQCLIVNKKNNEIISAMTMQTYSYRCGPLCGDGGRRFYVDHTLILEVVDWIS